MSTGETDLQSQSIATLTALTGLTRAEVLAHVAAGKPLPLPLSPVALSLLDRVEEFLQIVGDKTPADILATLQRLREVIDRGAGTFPMTPETSGILNKLMRYLEPRYGGKLRLN